MNHENHKDNTNAIGVSHSFLEDCKVKSIESSFLDVQTVVRKVLFQVLSPCNPKYVHGQCYV